MWSRQEKERLEERLANKQEEVEMTRNEVVKLKERLQSVGEEMKVLKNNTKTEVSPRSRRPRSVRADRGQSAQPQTEVSPRSRRHSGRLLCIILYFLYVKVHEPPRLVVDVSSCE